MQNMIILTIHPQYIVDADGNKSHVVLSTQEFDLMMEELEDLDDVRLYDDAKKEDTGERIPMEDAFKMIESKKKDK
ncbi:MAG: hypothetical protein JWO03_2819 [Bacteroidetes bacterium]|nr:hypothetical protein [Bacteroidota bacterium]